MAKKYPTFAESKVIDELLRKRLTGPFVGDGDEKTWEFAAGHSDHTVADETKLVGITASHVRNHRSREFGSLRKRAAAIGDTELHRMVRDLETRIEALEKRGTLL